MVKRSMVSDVDDIAMTSEFADILLTDALADAAPNLEPMPSPENEPSNDVKK